MLLFFVDAGEFGSGAHEGLLVSGVFNKGGGVLSDEAYGAEGEAEFVAERGDGGERKGMGGRVFEKEGFERVQGAEVFLLFDGVVEGSVADPFDLGVDEGRGEELGGEKGSAAAAEEKHGFSSLI